MTIAAIYAGVRAVRPTPWAISVIVAGMALASCTTASIDDAFPEAPQQQAVTPAAEPVSDEQAAIQPAEAGLAPAAPAVATDGDYPNLNIPAERATEQRSPADSRARLSELKAVQRQREKEEASNKVVSEEKRLRKLSRTRPKEVLREIEGE